MTGFEGQGWEDDYAEPVLELEERADESLDELYRYPEDASAEDRADWLEAMLLERAHRRRVRPIDFYEPLKAFVPFHLDVDSKERWVIGGNRSGKTTATVADAVMLATGRATWWKGPPHEIWIVSVKTSKSLEVVRPLLRALMPPDLIGPGRLNRWRHEKTERESVLQLPPDPAYPNSKGWIIRFKSCDQGRQAFESGSVALVVFDEEPVPEVYEECYTRTIDCGGRIVVGFTPLNGITWQDAHEAVYVPWERMLLENEVLGEAAERARAAGEPLTDEQRDWEPLTHAVVDPEAGIHVFTAGMMGNPINTEKQLELLRKRWGSRPLILRVRLYGHWIETSEEAIIDISGFEYYEGPAPPKNVAFKSTAAWIDARYSERRTKCDGAIAIASKGTDGRRYMRETHWGQWGADEQVAVCAGVLIAYGCPRTFVQNEPGDLMFARLLNKELSRMDGGKPCVKTWPETGATPSKTVRANELQPIVQAREVVLRTHHDAKFRQQAGVFSPAYEKAGGPCDVFDAGMGAIMMCEFGTPEELRKANERARAWSEEQKAPQSRADRLAAKGRKKRKRRYQDKVD